MIKSKKQSLIVIGVFALVMMLGTVTYAFFNYTRTGSANNFSVGRLFFKSDNEETITLSNLFPIDPSNTTDMADPTKVGTYSIDIVGDTDYTDGVEYLVSITDSNISNLPISIDVSVSNGLGTSNDNYFTARESKNASIYKRLMGNTITGDGMLLVGYVKPNTTSGVIEGVDGTITITAYLDKNKILITDTYDGTESDNMGTPNSMAEGKTVISTSDWNDLSTNGISFKVKVEANEGIWVHESLEMIMKRNAVMDNIQSTYVSASTGIDFGAISSDTNGKGVYMRAGTENDENPIMYYRGAVEDNNVVFNNLCWKAVRTTDTGGVKLIYNGELFDIYDYQLIDIDDYLNYSTSSSTIDFNFDSNTKKWTTSFSDAQTVSIQFSLSSGDYKFTFFGAVFTKPIFTKNGVDALNYGGPPLKEYIVELNNVSNSDVFMYSFSQSFSGTTSTPFLYVEKKGSVLGSGCNNTSEDSLIEVNENDTMVTKFSFNTYIDSAHSPAYVGYMYGDVYTHNSGEATSGAYYGSSFTYDGTNYTLVDPVTTKNNTHHYTCNLTTAEGTCTTIRYYYYGNYYVNLTGGEGIERAMEKMQTNTNNSNAKTQIDSWYASNMTGVTSKLEDTIWCNDRSVGNGNNNGWIANGGDLNTDLYYGAYQRSNFASSTSTEKNQPSLVCPQKNDAFTVRNGNGNRKLIYPVALLTEDEIVLAGSIMKSQSYSSNYLTDSEYWLMSPALFYYRACLYGIGVNSNNVDSPANYSNELGLRPAISIKPGQMIKSGTGTVLDPYVIE